MGKETELIKDLISQAEAMTYQEGSDAIMKRADMLVRKIFGQDSEYINNLSEIGYSPIIWSTSTSDEVFKQRFYSGKRELLNLLNVMLEDLTLDEKIKVNPNSDSATLSQNSNVFIVHGHNEEMKQHVARIITQLGLNPIILHEQASQGKTIIEKFGHYSKDIAFAVCLLSADDIAHSKDEDSTKSRFRSRQNVIFELGFFIGKISRSNVLAIHELVENFEIPSDYQGVLFIPYDSDGKWKFDLVKELKAAGIEVDANKII